MSPVDVVAAISAHRYRCRNEADLQRFPMTATPADLAYIERRSNETDAREHRFRELVAHEGVLDSLEMPR